MRRPLWLVLLVVAVGAAAGYWYANRPRVPSPTTTTTSVSTLPTSRPTSGSSLSLSEQIRQAVEALVREAAANPAESALPEGTRLLSLRIEGDLVILDLSSEFSSVNNMGNTGESIAQRALLTSVAQFDSVRRLRVLMDGKVFEGEHSGPWDNLPVRAKSLEARSAQ